MKRRDFLTGTGLCSTALFGSLMQTLTSNNALAQGVESGADIDALDPAIMEFWSNHVRRPSYDFNLGVERRGVDGAEPTVLLYEPSVGFISASEVDDDVFAKRYAKLMPEKGQVNVSVRVQRFRPSRESQESFQNLGSAGLRIDVKQTEPLPSLTEALAWTAIAALVPNAQNKLPALQTLEFDPSQSWKKLQEIPLVNGLGFWTLNFFAKARKSLWGQLVDGFREAVPFAAPLFPILGLPAIGLTALAAVDKLFGYIQAKGASLPILKGVDTAIYATKEGKNRVGKGGIPLRRGEYLIIPQKPEQLLAFSNARDGLALKGGYLIEKGTKELPELNALKQLPTVDYFSLYVDVSADKAK